ncbi:MAG: hypothetical protein HY060_01590, partial [Proteobacteria bacterium]|nr:hypothetical protein [Pseudomonadota bacterium]
MTVLSRTIGWACVLAIAGTLSACDWFDFLGTSKAKTPLPGKRIAVLQTTRDFEPDPRLADEAVKLPRPQRNPDWPQAGGYPDHVMFHLELPDELRRAWRTSIGSGTDSRSQLYAGPVVANGRVFTIDTGGDVSALSPADANDSATPTGGSIGRPAYFPDVNGFGAGRACPRGGRDPRQDSV